MVCSRILLCSRILVFVKKKICKRYTDITASNDFPNDDIHKKLSYRGKGKAKKKWISIRFY